MDLGLCEHNKLEAGMKIVKQPNILKILDKKRKII